MEIDNVSISNYQTSLELIKDSSRFMQFLASAHSVFIWIHKLKSIRSRRAHAITLGIEHESHSQANIKASLGARAYPEEAFILSFSIFPLDAFIRAP